MNLTTPRLLAFLSFFLPLISLAAPPILVPAWQTEAVFEQPESVVFDLRRQQFYVSNVNGNPTEAAGNGYISTVSLDGTIKDLHWLDGFNAPKGMTQVADRLYVADINEVVVINLLNKEIVQRYSIPNAKFLNDVAADNNGNVYVSDMLTNSIYRLMKNGKVLHWIHDEKLEYPNGLLIEGGEMIVASWGVMTDGFSTETPGHLKRIFIAKNAHVKSLGDKTPAGNLDGIESDGNGNYYVTDWMAGKLLHITPEGISTTLLSLEAGSADLTVVNKDETINSPKNLIVIPMMNSGYITAYEIKETP